LGPSQHGPNTVIAYPPFQASSVVYKKDLMAGGVMGHRPDLRRGTIPAGAGSRSASRPAGRPGRDHPRGCGSCQPRWCLEDAVCQRWQPRIRAQARKQAATSTGLVLDTRARFGFTAAPDTTDDARIRHLTLALPPHHAARLFDAQDQGAGEQQLRALAAEALGEVYFRDGGRRAAGLDVEFTDVEHVEFDL
jgi:hypothetical protein